MANYYYISVSQEFNFAYEWKKNYKQSVLYGYGERKNSQF